MNYVLQIYGNTDKYSYGRLSLIMNQTYHSYSPTGDIAAYLDSYRRKFTSKHFTQIHLMVLKLDPKNGISEILVNEYAENPLLEKTKLNAEAESIAKARTFKVSPPPEVMLSDEPEELDEEDEE